MAALLAAGGLDRRGAAVAGVVVAAREALDRAAVSDDLRGQHRPDSVDLGHARARGGDRGGDVLAVARQRGVQSPQIGHQLAGQLLALGVDGGHRMHPAQQRGGLLGGQVALGPAGDEVAQQRVQPIRGAGAFAGQVVAALGQQPQHQAVVLRAHRVQPPVVLGDHRDRGSVDGVGLAGMSGVEQPGPRGQLGGHIHDGFVGGGQALRDAATEPGGAFDRPLPVRPLLRPRPAAGRRCRG